ncbi:UNVERIFIED_CONTAM: hypothetical protein Sindi_1726000 [Sesamum indicum]
MQTRSRVLAEQGPPREQSPSQERQAVAQFVAQQPANPPPPSPRRSRELSSTPEEEEQRWEEVNSKISRPEVTQTQGHNLRRESFAPPPPKGVEDSYLSLVVAPPRHSPFAPNILAEVLPASLKVSNLSEYDGTGDPQEHLDKFYAKIDWYDLSDAAYCKVFRTTLSKCALAWFNQLPAGTISSLEQLNLLPGIFKESIASKPPSTMEDLLVRSQKYIRIEESNALDSLSGKRKGREEENEPKKKEESKHVPSAGFAHYTPLNTPRGEILMVAEQQGLISQWPAKMKVTSRDSNPISIVVFIGTGDTRRRNAIT